MGWCGEGRGAREDVLVLERVGSAMCHPEIRTQYRCVRQGVGPSLSILMRVFQPLKTCTEHKGGFRLSFFFGGGGG